MHYLRRETNSFVDLAKITARLRDRNSSSRSAMDERMLLNLQGGIRPLDYPIPMDWRMTRLNPITDIPHNTP
jgi:hypothetical protein